MSDKQELFDAKARHFQELINTVKGHCQFIYDITATTTERLFSVYHKQSFNFTAKINVIHAHPVPSVHKHTHSVSHSPPR